MNKKRLLENLQQETFCRLASSKIHGLGVFAVRDIPKGTNPFQGSKEVKIIRISEKEIAALRRPVIKMIKDFCPIRKGYYLVPDFGMNAIDIAHYLNHSDYPNIETIYSKKTRDTEFKTSRNVKAGEELTSDYSIYSDEVTP